MSEWVHFGIVEDIPEGTYSSQDFDGTQIVVFNLKGDFFALEDVCTHDGTLLTHGQSMDDGEIVCPRHGARFCIRTGEALSAPAWEATKKFQLRIEGKNILFLDDRWD